MSLEFIVSTKGLTKAHGDHGIAVQAIRGITLQDGRIVHDSVS